MKIREMKDNTYPTNGSQFSTLRVPISSATDFAKLVSNILCPPVLGLLTLLLIGGVVSSNAGWLWVAIHTATSLILPTLYIIMLVRLGKVSDFHIPIQSERILPLCFTVLVTTIAALASWRLNAPDLIQLIGYVTVVQTILILLITLRWKISLHCLAAAELATIGLYVLGLPALALCAAVPVIGWSRVHLQRHTLAQTIGGTLLGFIIIWAVVQFSTSL